MNIRELTNIRLNIQNVPEDVSDDEIFIKLLANSELLSITEQVFFERLVAIVDDIKKQDVVGDFVECGVWAGATAVYLKALLNYFELNKHKKMYLYDTFEGIPSENIPVREKDKQAFFTYQKWNNITPPTLNMVKNNFRKFNLLDEQVVFVKGNVLNDNFYCSAPKIALLRLDLDFYEPTYCLLEKLYNRVSKNGYIIIDDFNVDKFNCYEAVMDFRKKYRINEPIKMIGRYIGYWKKS